MGTDSIYKDVMVRPKHIVKEKMKAEMTSGLEKKSGMMHKLLEKSTKSIRVVLLRKAR
jgi:hypothetical protein